MIIPELGSIRAFVILVDINRFAKMVKECQESLIAQFTRDVLSGAISAIEKENGEVIGFMGDAILGMLPDPDATACACFGIAKDLNSQCEYLSETQKEIPESWTYAPGGPSLKISVEYGTLDISTIQSKFLGTQKLLIGDAINYAARISHAGSGNRCLIGPMAVKEGISNYQVEGPFFIRGKRGEGNYEYYRLPLGDFWIEGRKKRKGLTYWP
jgi:class 3 adenylate cyclase